MTKTIRNIIIVSLFTVGGGWLGIWLNNVTGNTMPPMQSLGALIWLASPALAGFALRTFGGDGWKDSGFGLHLLSSWKWYLLAILIYPLASLVTFGLGTLFGITSAEGLSTQGFSAYLSAVGVIFIGSLIKNFFEEFAWRSYLTPRLEAAGAHPIVNHVLVGILWMSWHLPYYYYYLDRTVLESSITTSIPVFIALGYLVMIPTAILFGELRLISKSTWVVFALHQVINAVSMPLLINGFIEVKGPLAPVFTPTNEGLFVSLLFGVTGWLLMKKRLQTQA
ncbi:MAG TPA: CPBP family intramembrane metalloprotease [Anaerolineales bacterium]|nr:CPBP family intramembrane metalloprotease [Anaerolineales bacterium]